MAGSRQQQFVGLGLLQLTLPLCLLYPPLGALRWDGDSSSSPSSQSYMVVRGTFSRPILSIGYHKILEIPAGAQNITIRETVKSRNYLALRTRAGVSIVNGNWAVDRPGLFIAVGTKLMYKRPNEIRSRAGESITSPGPTAEELDLYLIYQQPGPSVQYEYSLPLPNTHPEPEPDTHPDILSMVETAGPAHTVSVSPSHKDKVSPSNKYQVSPAHVFNVGPSPTDTVSPAQSDERSHRGGNDGAVVRQDHPNQLPSEPEVNSDPQPRYTWTRAGLTACSATCGTGRRQVLWDCIETETQALVSADLCDLTQRPPNQEEDCNTQPCPAFWDLGEWSECSKRCGPGFQHRQVLCRQVTGNNGNETAAIVTVAAELCGYSDRPVTTSPCQLKICSQWQIRSEWSLCSVPCGVGQRSREVVCLGSLGDAEEDEECNLALKPDRLLNCDMGTCARSWYTSLWSQRCSAECGQGSRSRSAVCLKDHVTSLPLDSCEGERPQEVTPCDAGPCHQRLEWYTGLWGQCSAECGNGTQTRGVACLLHNDGGLEAVDQSRCAHLPQPITSQTCRLKPCGVQWFITDWSACSRSCDGGYRVREVRCLADSMAPSVLCDPSQAPEGREECNAQPCLPETSPGCRDQYHNCAVVVQARLCVYPYYRTACCVSCSRVAAAAAARSNTLARYHLRR